MAHNFLSRTNQTLNSSAGEIRAGVRQVVTAEGRLGDLGIGAVVACVGDCIIRVGVIGLLTNC